MQALLAASISVAFFHSLAPDHWLPFVALAKSARWPMKKLAWVTALAGTGHVLSSLLLGLIGLWAGLAIHRLEGAETWRGSIGIWLLIGFGVSYALWGFKHAQHHHPHAHPHVSVQDVAKAYAKRRVWMLFAIMIFGPCEPLIPLMFVAAQEGMPTVWGVSAVFSLVTIAMVMGQSMLAFSGVKLIKSPWIERYAHSLAGLVIVLTALFVLVNRP